MKYRIMRYFAQLLIYQGEIMKIDRDLFFREVTIRISSSLEIRTALSSLKNYLRDYMPIDNIGLYYFSKDYRYITALAKDRDDVSLPERRDELRQVRIDTEMRREIEEIKSRNNLVVIYNDPLHAPLLVRRHFPDLRDYSLISLPLVIEGEPIGGMGISARGPDRFANKHAELLELVKEPIALAMSNARRYQELVKLKNLLAEDNRALGRELEQVAGTQVVGAEFGLRRVMEMVRLVAQSNSPVLLLGDTGTGKEVIANAIHLTSSRRNAPMIRVQCGAIPETLLDSELFGHEKGAFTGAIERKRGRFERADKGTIFLDEIAELTPEAQVKLLRVLQEKEFERVGGTETISVDVRVIAATHRNPEEMVRERRFREDLWFRLNVFPIHIPPLRQRREDIPSLVQYFVERKAREMNLEHIPTIPADAIKRLQTYNWPGNVRELENLIERALILNRGDSICFPELGTSTGPLAEETIPVGTPSNQTLAEVEKDYIKRTLNESKGKIAGPGGAAERLGINSSTLRSRMKKLEISPIKPNSRLHG
ncbi:MAG: sigma 54-interacting transcriptional regulator [Candidatus Auribacterota bacterium]|nr:sigma 54-interacting transcriptional regulator [Candidatus Auribacterota bacterium]